MKPQMSFASIPSLVREDLEGVYYSTTDAARLVGRSPKTLARMRQKGIYVPSERLKLGGIDVWLYTPEDIRALEKLLATIKPGRKPKGEGT